MASSRSFFEIVGPGFLQCWVPSRAYAGDTADLTGQSATRLRPGEFLELDENGKAFRAPTPDNGAAPPVPTPDVAATVPCFPYFSETGRGDIVTGGKVPVIFGPTYEAETKLVKRSDEGVMDPAFEVGDRLVVCSVFAPDDLNNEIYRGVRRAVAGDEGAVCVGFVTRVLPDSIRFISTLCVL